MTTAEQLEFIVVKVVDMSWDRVHGRTGVPDYQAFKAVPPGGCFQCGTVHPDTCETCWKPATFSPCEGSWCSRHDPFGKGL